MAATERRYRRGGFGGLAGAVRLLPRRWSADGVVIVPLVVALLAVSFLAAAAPRYLNRLADRALQHTLATAAEQARSIDLVVVDRIDGSSGAQAFAPLEQRGAEYTAELPPELQRFVTAPTYRVESPGLLLVDDQGVPLYDSSWQYPSVRFRYTPGLDQGVQLLEGRLPELTEPVQPGEPLPGGALADQATPVFEIAVTPESAELLRMGVGERVLVQPDADDPLAADVPSALLDVQAVVEIVGLIAPGAGEGPNSAQAAQLLEPSVSQNGERLYIDAPGLLAPEAYRGIYHFTAPVGWRYSWRYDLLAGQLDAGDVDGLHQAVVMLKTFGGAEDGVTILTSLDQTLDQFQDAQQLTAALLLTAAIGAGASLLLLLYLLASLVIRRRQPALTLLRSRGATKGQLLLVEGVEAALLVALAATIGYLAALLIVDARASVWSLVSVALVGALVVLLILRMTAVSVGAGDRGGSAGCSRTPHTTSARRFVFDGLLVLIAVVGVILVRQRGVAGGAGEGAAASDPLLAAVPTLMALAVGVLVIRLYPYPLRALARLTARRRTLTPFLSMRRAADPPATFRTTFLALTLALATGSFVAIVSASVDAAQETAAWEAVGADYLIRAEAGAPPTTEGVDAREIDGVSGAVTSYTATGAELGNTAISLVALDTAAYAALTAGTPAATDFPAEFSANLDAATVPALASPATGMEVGEQVVVNVGTADIPVTIVAVRADLPGSSPDEAVLMLPAQSVETSPVWDTFRPTSVYIRAGADVGDELTVLAATDWPGAEILSRRALLEAQRAEPLSSGMRSGFRMATLIGGLAAVLALLIATALTAGERVRDLAYLVVLGLSRRQVTALVVGEQMPLIVASAVTGVGVALGTAYLMLSRFGLQALVVAASPVPLDVPWGRISLLVAALIVLLLGSVAGLLLLLGRVGPARIVRFSD